MRIHWITSTIYIGTLGASGFWILASENGCDGMTSSFGSTIDTWSGSGRLGPILPWGSQGNIILTLKGENISVNIVLVIDTQGYPSGISNVILLYHLRLRFQPTDDGGNSPTENDTHHLKWCGFFCFTRTTIKSLIYFLYVLLVKHRTSINLLDSQYSLSQKYVSACSIYIIVTWVSGMDHKSIDEFHCLCSLTSKFSWYYDFASFSSTFHDES